MHFRHAGELWDGFLAGVGPAGAYCTGMSYLGGEIRIVAPVLAGDTVRVAVTIADKRETKKPDRGIVTYTHTVTNQRGEVVLEAQVKRMIKRVPARG
mgnify:CR=1 FL=1